MDSKRITVIGSSNTDMVIKTLRLPAPGETILGGDFFMNAGGKGANQAVAAARLGGEVTFIAKTGDDIFGREAQSLFHQEGIDTRFVLTDPKHPSGIALITVDQKGENCIAVASGANGALLPEDLQPAHQQIQSSAFVLMQLEIPLETVQQAANLAYQAGVRVVLNPAPAMPLSNELLSKLFLITPNETEAELITGIPVTDIASATKAAEKLTQQGVKGVIITLGSLGALLYLDGVARLIQAPKVEAVDTTAAGDVFNGALVVALARGESAQQAVDFACRAAAISVTRLGAQASAPYQHEL